MAKSKKMKSRRSHGDGSVVWDRERSCFKAFLPNPMENVSANDLKRKMRQRIGSQLNVLK